MSKKKSFSGSTMTLKDFHGGNIPSDLALPSAPGMTVDRSRHDRQVNRSYGGERGSFLRQSGGSGVRTFEDKALYFPNPANIGRNYDEDERKPVEIRRGNNTHPFEDQVYEDRRASCDKPDKVERFVGSTFSDSWRENIHGDFGLVPVRPPPRAQIQSSQEQSQPISAYRQGTLVPSSSVFDESSGLHESTSAVYSSSQCHQSSISPSMSGSRQGNKIQSQQTGLTSRTGASNVWLARKGSDFSRGLNALPASSDTSAAWKTQTSASRITQASAVEKVSSGRWNSRLSAVVRDQPLYPVGKYSQTQGQSYGDQNAANDITEPSHDAFPTQEDFGEMRSLLDNPQKLSIENVTDGNNDHPSNEYINKVPQLDSGGGSSLQTGSFPEQDQDADRKMPFPPNKNKFDSGVLSWDSMTAFGDDNQGKYVGVRYGFAEPGGRLAVSNTNANKERNIILQPGQATCDNVESVGSADYNNVEGYYNSCSDSNKSAFTKFRREYSGNLELKNDMGSGGHIFFRPGEINPLQTDTVRGNFSNIGSIAATERERVEFSQHRDVGPVCFDNFARDSIHEKADSNSEHRGYFQHNNVSPILTNVGRRDHTEPRATINDECGHYAYHKDGANALHGTRTNSFEDGQSVYVIDGGLDFPGDETFADSMRGPNFSDASKTYISQRSKDYVQGLPADNTAIQTQGFAGHYSQVNCPMHTTLGLPRSLASLSNNLESTHFQGVPRRELQQSGGGLSAQLLSSGLPPTNERVVISAVQGSISNSRFLENQVDIKFPVDQPKLTLEPHFQLIDVLSDVGPAKARQSVFGGARPREVVLKERGVDDAIIAGIEMVRNPERCPTSDGSQNNCGASGHQGDSMELNKAGDWKWDSRHTEHSETDSSRYGDKKDFKSAQSDIYGRKSRELDEHNTDDRGGYQRYENRHCYARKESERVEIDAHDTWRYLTETSESFVPCSPSLPSDGISNLCGTVERLGYNYGSSAADLAHAFSHLTPLGTGIGGYANQHTVLPPSPVHPPGMSYGASTKDTPFSRLTETLPLEPSDSFNSGVSRR